MISTQPDRRLEGVLRVAVGGAIDPDTDTFFHDWLVSLCREGQPLVQLDLSGIDAMDHAGVATLCSLAGRLERQGRRLAVVAASEAVERAVRLSRCDLEVPSAA